MKKDALKELVESFVIKPRFKHGDVIYFYAKDVGISKLTVGAMHALLRDNGTFVVFYSAGDKKKYKPVDVVEECLAFSTPEEVAAKMVEKFKTLPDEKPEE